MVLQFLLEGPRPCTILCFNVYATVEYLNRNVSIGQLLQHFLNVRTCNVVCARSRPKMLTKTYKNSKKFVGLHNHCLLLTIYVPINRDLPKRRQFILRIPNKPYSVHSAFVRSGMF